MSTAPPSQPPPAGEVPRLDPQQVHLWRIDTPVHPVLFRKLGEHLSPDEKARADQFANPEHRSRFITRRGLMRRILATYHQADPANITFDYGPQGKPVLRPLTTAGAPLHFNLSHSHDLALLAITRVGCVGVDLEAINPKRDLAGIAQRFFHPSEWQTLKDTPVDDQPAMFFDLWACKEAVVKTQGGGIVSGIDTFSILGASPRPGRRTTTMDAVACQPYTLQSIRLADLTNKPYVAAVCLASHEWSLHTPIFNAPL